jgi:hypothetical protein
VQHLLELSLRFLFGSVSAFVKFVKCVEILDVTGKVFKCAGPTLDLFYFSKDLLRVLRIIPESRVECFFFQ